MARRRVTIDQVAAASGASSASVSLALRNKPGVSRNTRERILAAAQELGYSGAVRAGNPKAPALLNIALIFRTWSENPEQTAPAVSPFYSSVLAGIQEAGVDSAMNLLLGTIPVDSKTLLAAFRARSSASHWTALYSLDHSMRKQCDKFSTFAAIRYRRLC